MKHTARLVSISGSSRHPSARSRARRRARPPSSKVEPPSWWAGHSINPVRVMLRGRNLHGARVEAIGAGLSTGLVRVNERGTYLFVDVTIDERAAAGTRRLRVSTAAGAVEAPFEISRRRSRARVAYQGFTTDDVIYFIMPDRFADGDPSNNNPAKSPGLLDRTKGRYYHGGDFQGIIDRLPYLKDLGVTALWINPVYDNTDRLDEREMYPEVEGGPKRPTTAYHGYGAIDFYGVEEHYGDMKKLRELVDKAHAAGLKVIQDQIANHTSPYHPWATERPTPTWFYGTVENHLSNNWQKWTTMDPHATRQTQRRNLEGWFIDILPDLNQDDEEVRRYLIQNTLWWLGQVGFDAIRMDTLPHVPRHFWRDWSAAIKREYPQRQHPRRAVRRRPRAPRLLPERARRARRPRHRHRHALRLRALLRRARRLRQRRVRPQARQRPRARLPLPEPARARPVPRRPRHAALHERAGRDRRRLEARADLRHDDARHAAPLLRRRAGHARRRRPRQPPRLPGRLRRGRAQRLHEGRAHGGRERRVRAPAAPRATARRTPRARAAARRSTSTTRSSRPSSRACHGDQPVVVAFNNDTKPATFEFDGREAGVPERRSSTTT